MQNQIICPSCNQQYRDDNLPRLLVACGHTYCQACLISFLYENYQEKEGDDQGEQGEQGGEVQTWIRCPDDQIAMKVNEGGVQKFPKNFALIRIIEGKKQSNSFKDNEINVSKITKNSSIHQQQDTNQLINIIDSNKLNRSSINSSKDKQKLPKSHPQNQQQYKSQKQSQPCLCPTHRKPMDIVCTVDLKKICASCAIFGQHRGHSFKSLEEVSEMQAQYCDQILAIISQKQKLSKQICCNQTKKDLLSLLTSKRNKLRSRILQQFQKFQSKLHDKKKQTLKKLQQIVKKQQTNFKNCIKFDDQIISNYQQWQKKANSQIKILAQNDFQAKLLLLFQGKNIDGDIVEDGKLLIEEMKIQEENILAQVQKKLQGLTMSVNDQIYDNLQTFVVVEGQSKPSSKTMIPVQSLPQLQISSPQQQITQSKAQPISQFTSTMINTHRNTNTNTNIDQASKKIYSTTTEHQNSYLRVNNHERSHTLINISDNRNNHSINNNNHHHNLDQSLLENQDDFDQQENMPDVVDFNIRMSTTVQPVNSFRSPPLSQRFSIQPNIETPLLEKPFDNKMKLLKSPKNQIIEVKSEKMTKKRLSRMKLPQRYQKIVQNLLSNTLQILDLTNAELGDSNISLICQNIPNTKVRTVKLIRNKLTDQGILKILPYLTQITTLNISQNLLTQNILDILYQNKKYLTNLRILVVSQNKIIQRKHKGKIDKLKKLQWNVSV